MFQLKFYALVIYKKTQELPKMLRLLYMKDSQVLALEPNMKDIEITLQKVESVAEQIFNSKATSTWPTQVSKLCDYCYFKPICPEFQKN
jgi:putative RecB family exonuclease